MQRRSVVPLVVLFLGLFAGLASGANEAAFDLIERVAADPSPPDGVSIVFRGAHRQTRTSVQVPLPGAVSYPAAIPPGASLSVGHTLSSAAFMVETPELAEPARFLIRFTEDDGPDTILLDHRVDPRNVEGDRAWFDDRIDLGRLSGKHGTLTFAVENLGDADKAKHSGIFWSAPRIVVDAEPDDTSVVFITVDCLRADHLGSHGYSRDITPNLDALASTGVRFANAYANAPMTLPSIPQIFTSRVFPTRDQDILTHPIARAGISNAAYVNNAWIPLWLSQGGHAEPPGTFDRLVSGDRDARAITDEALQWLDQHPTERFALYLHYLDAHTPYRPPREYIERYAAPDYTGPVGDTFNDSEGADTGKYNEADRKKIIALYDASIHYVDDQIGRVFEALEANGRLDRTLIVVSADHGEEFWDHGRFFHGQSLYDELLHVPLIVRLPRADEAGSVIERPVRSIDIAPSILEWLSLPRPDGFTGGSLAEAIAKPNEDGEPLFATATQAQFPTRYAVRTRTQKLIESLDTGKRELYRVDRDPAEKNDEGGAAAPDSAPLVQSLEGARQVLRERGYQVRIVGPKSGSADVRVRLEGHPKSGTFLSLDRRSEGARPTITITPDGMNLEAHAEVGSSGSGFRFDRLPHSRNLGKKDLVRMTITVDGTPVERKVVALGEGGLPPRTDLIDLRNRRLAASTEPPCEPPDSGARLCVWRYPGERFLAIPEIKDPAVREKLRALGYLQ